MLRIVNEFVEDTRNARPLRVISLPQMIVLKLPSFPHHAHSSIARTRYTFRNFVRENTQIKRAEIQRILIMIIKLFCNKNCMGVIFLNFIYFLRLENFGELTENV